MEVREKAEVIQIQKETMESHITDKYDNGKLRWDAHANKHKVSSIFILLVEMLLLV